MRRSPFYVYSWNPFPERPCRNITTPFSRCSLSTVAGPNAVTTLADKILFPWLTRALCQGPAPRPPRRAGLVKLECVLPGVKRRPDSVSKFAGLAGISSSSTNGRVPGRDVMSINCGQIPHNSVLLTPPKHPAHPSAFSQLSTQTELYFRIFTCNPCLLATSHEAHTCTLPHRGLGAAVFESP
jgi:hypothetical protein